MNYIAKLIFSDRALDIEVSMSGFSTEETAHNFANTCGSLYILPGQGKGELILVLEDPTKEMITIPEDQAIYSVDKKREQRPRPLDPSKPEDMSIILGTLDDKTSLYHVYPEDMQKIDGNLSDIWQGKVPFSFGHAIAEEITSL